MHWRGWRRSCPRRCAMSDRLDRLEAELAEMRPRPLPTGTVDDIGHRLATAARPWADRMLLSAVSAGGIAACVIAAVLLREMTATPTQLGPTPVIAASPTASDAPLAFARADVRWADELR